MADWVVVYQSRSGRPGDPWLEPDVCDFLRGEVELIRAQHQRPAELRLVAYFGTGDELRDATHRLNDQRVAAAEHQAVHD